MRYVPIVPAVIPDSAAAVKAAAEQLKFAREFHLDVVDGVFVKTTSWPIVPLGEPLTVKPQLDQYTLEVDLMVAQPVTEAQRWIAAGADMLVFHVETLSPSAFEHFAETAPVSVGVSCHGQTTMDTLATYLPFADYVQLMGIAEIGAQRQPFDEAVFEKIDYVKTHYPQLSITVDGSVNKDTIARLFAAGVDRFVVGSAITGQPDPEAAHQALQALING